MDEQERRLRLQGLVRTGFLVSIGDCPRVNADLTLTDEYRIEAYFTRVGARVWTGERWVAHYPAARRYTDRVEAEREAEALRALLALEALEAK